MANKFKLGILLVHGIGNQRTGETLVKWGDSLAKTLMKATGNKLSVFVEGTFSKTEENNSEVVLNISSGNVSEKWLVSEGWWADSFIPPSYFELVSWSIRAIPWVITLQVAQQHWQDLDKKNTKWDIIKVWAYTIFKLLIALLLAPLFVALLVITFILGTLPIPQLRSFFLAAQGTLVANVGDSLAFVESPVRAALIRKAIMKKLISLKSRCESTVILAHSQGAAVVLDALGGIDESLSTKEGGLKDFHQKNLTQVPDTLITFGAGTNQLANLKILAANITTLLNNNKPWLGIGLVLLIPVFFVWLFIKYSLLEAIISFGVIIGSSLFCLVILKLPKLIENWIKIKDKVFKNIQIVIIVLYLLGVVALHIFSFLPASFILVYLLLSVIIFFISYLMNLLSKDFQRNSTIVNCPQGLERWIDIYASADPVPNGQTRSNTEKFPLPVKIHNQNSFIFDHTSYWSNKDGFILRILKYCGETAKSSWLEHLPVVSELIDKRANYRNNLLNVSYCITFIMSCYVAYSLWSEFGSKVSNVVTKSLTWLPDILLVQVLVWILIMLIVVYILSTLLKLIWKWWVFIEQDAYFNRMKITSIESRFINGIIAYNLFTIFLSIFTINSTMNWFEMILISIIWIFIFSWLIKRYLFKKFPITAYPLPEESQKDIPKNDPKSFTNIL